MTLYFPTLGTDGTNYAVTAFSPEDRYVTGNGTPLAGLILKSGPRLLRWIKYGEYGFLDTPVRLRPFRDVGL